MNFNTQQKYSLLSKMGYTGSMQDDEMDAFLQSNPGAAAKMGKFDRAMSRGFATGGLTFSVVNPDDPAVNASRLRQEEIKDRLNAANQKAKQTGDFTEVRRISGELAREMANFVSARDDFRQRTGQTSQKYTPPGQTSQKYTPPVTQGTTDAGLASELPTTKEMTAQALLDPSSLVTKAEPKQIKVTPDQLIPSGAGQITTPLQEAEFTPTAPAETAQAPERTPAAQMTAEQVTDEIDQTLADVEAVTAEPTKEATVRGQLESLMEDFEGGQTPPWASGAMRNAMALMQQRGLGASSMAGAAVVQAAMESALPIAAQDAQTQAQFEMQNLNNEQQTLIFKTQQRITGLLSDQAAINAAEQFNAASENQTNQFFADLESTVARFNADQINAINQFNAGQKNAISQFNASLKAQRDQFNASNRLVVAQANAKWRQNVATFNTDAQNEAIMEAAKTANSLTAGAMDEIWQRERDLMSYAWQSSENAQDRSTNLLIADKQVAAEQALQASSQAFADNQGKGAVLGNIAAAAAPKLIEGIFGLF